MGELLTAPPGTAPTADGWAPVGYTDQPVIFIPEREDMESATPTVITMGLVNQATVSFQMFADAANAVAKLYALALSSSYGIPWDVALASVSPAIGKKARKRRHSAQTAVRKQLRAAKREHQREANHL